jgi:putative ABC transport system permease protein
LFRSQAANPGFETRSVFHLSIDLRDDPVKAAILRRQAIERLKALPEVANVALADRLPYAGTSSRPFLAETRTAAVKGAPGSSLLNYVSPSFFDTVNIPLVRGRSFSPQESEGELPVAIVSESTARHAWPGEDPIGKRLKLDLKFSGDWSTFQVIGVAKDVRFFNLSRTDPAYVYLPANPSQFSSLLFRAAQSRKDTLAAVRSSLSNLDRGLSPTLGFMSLDDFMRSQQLLPQASAVFMGILALLALALAAVGIYGVMAYVVSRRTREVGIRLALGASGGEVLRLLLRQGLIPVFAGAGCGLALSAVVSGLLRTALAFPANPDLLFGVSAFDPAVYAGLTTFLAGVAMLACCVPAWRAMRVDPVVALRYE